MAVRHVPGDERELGAIEARVRHEARDVYSWSNGPGDRLVLPAGTTRAAIVGPSGCACIEGKL